MDENMLQAETVMNFRPKYKAFHEEPGSILCSDNSIEDMCDEQMQKPKKLIIDADFMTQNEKDHSLQSQKAVFDLNVAPRRVPCSDMSIEDVCFLKPKRFKLCQESWEKMEAVHTALEKTDYENQIIDMKRKVVVSETEEDFSQTCHCTLDSPCKQESCLRFKTIEYKSNFANDLHDQLLGFEEKEKKQFTYSFNLEIYSGIENITELKSVAKGGFGKVFKCSDSKSKCSLVMKKSKHIEPNEVEIPLRFQSELNIAQVWGCFFDGQDFYIIQEDAGVSLNKLQDQFEFLERHRQILIFSLQLFTGVNTLAQNSITHWDLKPENICLNIKDNSFLLKLIDFGSCRTSKDKKKLNGLTPPYLPPDFNKAYFEARKQHSQHKDSTQFLQLMSSLNSEVDIWAAGLIILYIYKKHHPMLQYFQKELFLFKDKKERDAANIRLIGQLSDPLDKYFTTGNETMDHLLSNILVVNRDLRWKASNIVKYIKGELEQPVWHQKLPEEQKSEKIDAMDVDLKMKGKQTILPEISLNEMKLQMSVSSTIKCTDQLDDDLKDFNLHIKQHNLPAIQAQQSEMEKSYLCLNETIRTETLPTKNLFDNQKCLAYSEENNIPRFDILLGNGWENF